MYTKGSPKITNQRDRLYYRNPYKILFTILQLPIKTSKFRLLNYSDPLFNFKIYYLQGN